MAARLDPVVLPGDRGPEGVAGGASLDCGDCAALVLFRRLFPAPVVARPWTV